MTDTVDVFGIQQTGIQGFQVQDSLGNWLTYVRPVGSLTLTDNGTSDVTSYASVTVAIPSASGVSF